MSPGSLGCGGGSPGQGLEGQVLCGPRRGGLSQAVGLRKGASGGRVGMRGEGLGWVGEVTKRPGQGSEGPRGSAVCWGSRRRD